MYYVGVQDGHESSDENGIGEVRWADGTIYKGERRSGACNGKGIFLRKLLHDPLSIIHLLIIVVSIIIIIIIPLSFHSGVATYPSKHVYEGLWKDDARVGPGVMKYPDGGVYEGDWLENKRSERG